MRERREKGVILILAIILLCLFLIFSFAKPPQERGSNETLSGDFSDLLNNDISVTDSGRPAVETQEEEPKDEMTFLMENLSFERTGSQLMTGVFSGILILYLIVIGPVSYFYLKKIGKMERMWLIIPVASLLFGCCVLLLGNALTIREPQTDVLTVLNWKEQTVSYAISTSPGEESYKLSFDESVESFQPVYMNGGYEVGENGKSLNLYPDYVFEKDYFLLNLEHIQQKGFGYVIEEQDELVTGIFVNETEYDFSHVMLCFGEWYCVVPAVGSGERFEVTKEDWCLDEYGMPKDLKNDLILQMGLTKDEEQIFNYAWCRYVNGGSDGLYITGILPDYEMGLENDGVDMISYGLFCQ